MTNLPLFISATEIAFILFVLVMVFGADKIPEIAKGLAQGIRGIKDATEEIKGEVLKPVYHTQKEPGKAEEKIEESLDKEKKSPAENTHSDK